MPFSRHLPDGVLLQYRENRDTAAIQLKLDVLLRAVEGARDDKFADLEHLAEEQQEHVSRKLHDEIHGSGTRVESEGERNQELALKKARRADQTSRASTGSQRRDGAHTATHLQSYIRTRTPPQSWINVTLSRANRLLDRVQAPVLGLGVTAVGLIWLTAILPKSS